MKKWNFGKVFLKAYEEITTDILKKKIKIKKVENYGALENVSI